MSETRVLEIRYLGNAKSQPDHDERVSFAHDGEGWNILIPESTLHQYFDGVSTLSHKTTLYGVLGIEREATTDEINKAFRRVARAWHADTQRVYKDNDENFIRAKEAHDILSNARTRAKYDAGLALESSTRRTDRPAPLPGETYRPPKRCGYVLTEGYQEGNKFVVTEILSWEEISNESGQVLTTSWDMGKKTYAEVWR